MGKTPFPCWIRHAARSVIALATVLALLVAPLIVILSHGPAAHAAAASTAAETAADAAAQGHAQDETAQGHEGGPFGGHNPADHDHQLHALLCQAISVPKPLPGAAQCGLSELHRHLAPEGPRRPPRLF